MEAILVKGAAANSAPGNQPDNCHYYQSQDCWLHMPPSSLIQQQLSDRPFATQDDVIECSGTVKPWLTSHPLARHNKLQFSKLYILL
jgi:hypothetical protein